jgi:phage tail protein X
VKLVRTQAGDTVGRILYQYLGRDDDEVAATFWAINPGIAKLGTVLPAGIELKIPDIDAQPICIVVSAWD